MKPTLVPGLTHTHRFTVTEEKTVGNLYPESPAFVAMPKVFATGFMVGFIEWACLEALTPHLDDGEGSLAAAMAQSYTSEHYKEATHRNIQVFGAIGFTWEMKNHLYYKRARCNAELLGSPASQREQVVRMLEQKAA